MAPPTWAYQVERCVSPPDESLVCPICSNLFCDPVEIPCQDVFCENCIHQWLQNQNNCPICHQLHFNSVVKIPILKNLINDIKIHCCNSAKGCMDTFSLINAEHHLENCPYDESRENKDDAMPMTYDEMKELCSHITNFKSDKLKEVVQIIKLREPSFQNNGDLEIDFCLLKPSTLRELKLYVTSVILNNPGERKEESNSDYSKRRRLRL